MLPSGSRVISGHQPERTRSERVLRENGDDVSSVFFLYASLENNVSQLTVPQGPPPPVEEGAVGVVIVAVVGVMVLGDDVLQVGVLPVQVAGLDRPCEHCSVRPRQGICERQRHQDIKQPSERD